MCKLIQYKLSSGKTVQVADIKSDYIGNIEKNASACDDIIRIVIFGSSIGDHCTDSSDIDVAIFGGMTPGKYSRSAKYKKFRNAIYTYRMEDGMQDYDILYFNAEKPGNSAILRDIRKGEVIYERAR